MKFKQNKNENYLKKRNNSLCDDCAPRVDIISLSRLQTAYWMDGNKNGKNILSVINTLIE